MSINKTEYSMSIESLQQALRALPNGALLTISSSRVVLIRGISEDSLYGCGAIAEELDHVMTQYYEEGKI